MVINALFLLSCTIPENTYQSNLNLISLLVEVEQNLVSKRLVREGIFNFPYRIYCRPLKKS